MSETTNNPNQRSLTRRQKLLAATILTTALASGAAFGVSKMQDNDRTEQTSPDNIAMPKEATSTSSQVEAKVLDDSRLTLVEAQAATQKVVDSLATTGQTPNKLAVMLNKRVSLISKNPNFPTRKIEIDSPILTSRTDGQSDNTLNDKFFSAVVIGEDKRPTTLTFSPDEWAFTDEGTYEKTDSGFRLPELSMNETGLLATTDAVTQNFPVGVLRIVSE